MRPVRVIVEGIKCSGKSTVIQALRRHVTTASVLEFRSYFHSCGMRYELAHDLQERLERIASFVTAFPDESFLMLRGHLFPVALAEALGQECPIDFVATDKVFARANLIVVLLTVNENAFQQRVRERVSCGRVIHEWDSNWQNLARMQDAYQRISKLCYGDCTIIDTSSLTVSECVDGILRLLQVRNSTA